MKADSAEGAHVPHGARLDCLGCGIGYDYRVKKDRSCPECGCPAVTVVEVLGPFNPDGTGGSRHIIGNPELEGWLEKNAAHLKTVKAKLYQREVMRKRRAEGKA